MQVEKLKNIKTRSECPVSKSLELIGDKWSLLIIRDLLFFDKKTYKDFQSSPEAISSNILADRLKKLMQYGIITKSVSLKSKLQFHYALTKKGKALKPVLKALFKWSEQYAQESAS